MCTAFIRHGSQARPSMRVSVLFRISRENCTDVQFSYLNSTIEASEEWIQPADPGVTTCWASSSVSHTTPPPSRLLGPENHQRSESNGTLKTPSGYCFHLLGVALVRMGSYFTPLHRLLALSFSVCVSITSSPVEVSCLCYYTSAPLSLASAERFKNQIRTTSADLVFLTCHTFQLENTPKRHIRTCVAFLLKMSALYKLIIVWDTLI